MLDSRSLIKVLALSTTLVLLAGYVGAQETAEGIMSGAWGDPQNEAGVHHAFTLSTDEGELLELELSPEILAVVGGPERLLGRRARVVLEAPDGPAPERESDGRTVVSLELLPEPHSPEVAGITGSKPWISILCKFANISSEPENLAYFQGMYGNSPGQLDHYWRELSYDQIDILGSVAVDWVTLPHSQTHYIPNPGSGSNSNLTELFNDCTDAANAAGVDFSNGGTGGYEGINLMFNDLLDCCAWGGSRWATLDGVTKSWRTTWNPPWGWRAEGVIAHEMGHGFGLPHSNNSDGDSNPYDSPWDVMSAATGYAVGDPTYGALGKHTIAYHKDDLGWIAPAELLEVTLPGVYSVTLDHLALPATSNYRMIRIPLSGSTSYVVEARERFGNYDGNLPGNAVLIFHVDPFRTEDAWVIDQDVPPAGYSDNEGTMWKVGETFEDLANEVQISVDGAAPNGFDVTVSLGVPPVVSTSPTSLDYGAVEVGSSSTLNVQIVNSSAGPQTALISGMVLSDDVNFSLDVNGGGTPCGTPTPQLAAGSFCTISIEFAPGVESSFSEELSVHSNASAVPLAVPIDASSAPCPFGDNVVLPDGTVNDTRTETACMTLTANDYEIGASGDVTFRAGISIVLGNGFAVQTGGRLTTELF